MKAEAREVRAEARLGTDDAQIRHQRQAQTAADRRTVDRADDRFARAQQAHRFDVQMPDPVRVRPVLDLAIPAKIAAVADV